ncbi:hypothetical protein K435DRAFT_881407 [Dendrothele bispora CBS 962.96]|uniref:Uncharacterized protein n=1 Tax=Dendrothele bispora (strain CBS 962.96) TaxID=1314807 RepID=A0A4S8KIH5_DENBC|nr:hypothetical protein K435DRAFT_881407 [Dendrothele bispora CBS 962.96]
MSTQTNQSLDTGRYVIINVKFNSLACLLGDECIIVSCSNVDTPGTKVLTTTVLLRPNVRITHNAPPSNISDFVFSNA